MANTPEETKQYLDELGSEYCHDCKFWLSMEGVTNSVSERGGGTCLRHAPIPMSTKLVGEAYHRVNWPYTHASDWCGEHQPETPTAPART